MIAAWMLHAAAAALLLALAAAGTDRLLRLTGRPTRWPWAAALLGSLLLPAGAWVAARQGVSAPVQPVIEGGAAATIPAALSLDHLLERASVIVEPASMLAGLDVPLLLLWLAASLGVAMWALLGVRRLARARREWRPAVVARTPVLVTGRTGPAVAGVVRPAVVLPEWALGADAETLELMLAHEREHVRAHDPALLAAAATAVALMPWNPALWWQLRRLRIAVEVDCDRRVLRRHPDRGRYGALLLEVGRRGARAGGVTLPLAALAASRSLPAHSTLERRIRIMTMSRPRHMKLQGTALAAAAGLLVLAACEMPRPTEVSPAGDIPLASIRGEGAYATDERVSVEQVRAALERTMPAEARVERLGKPHEIWIVSDAAGEVQRTEYMRRTPGVIRVEAGVLEAETSSGEIRVRGTRLMKVEGEGASETAGLAPEAIASVEILKLGAGTVTADPANVVWVRLKEGATLGSAATSRTRVLERPRVVRGTATEITVPSRDAAGSTVVQLSRPAGSADTATVLLRGSSMKAGLQPLYVVDGVLIEASRVDGALHDLLPDEIESIEVLKGPAAMSAYGTRGASGVIRVTTRKR